MLKKIQKLKLKLKLGLKKELQSKCEDLEKIVLKFSKGQNNLDKLLGSQRMSFNKESIGYNPLTKRKLIKSSSFKRHLNLTLVCVIAQL